jgi:hypothetical protein
MMGMVISASNTMMAASQIILSALKKMPSCSLVLSGYRKIQSSFCQPAAND